MEAIRENIIKATQCAGLLIQDLRSVLKSSVDHNDALYVLSLKLIEDASRIEATLSQLEKV